MLFTDTAFLFYFLPVALILHRLTISRAGGPYPNASRACMFLLTLGFYGATEPWWLLPFGFCLSMDFVLARALHRAVDERRRRHLVTLSIVQNLLVLVVFKYWAFLLRVVGAASPSVAVWLPTLTQDGHAIDLPPGISFYVFESLSFVIDVYRRDVVPPRQPLEFFAFIGMFPRFMAGPIVRYRDLQQQLREYAGMQVESGLYLFVIGFFLKCGFADSFADFTPAAFANWDNLGFVGAWLGVLAYTFQIYFDFSGYSLMAIGLGRCFGFRFPTNFNRPYLATSLQDFWRRWHISLSSWLRDYLYIPLGGSRRGEWFTYRNLLITMVLGGAWHGASSVFIAWGFWHGFALAAERFFRLENRGPLLARRLGTFLVVIVGWVFFKASGIPHALRILRQMANPASGLRGFNPELLRTHGISAALCAIGIAYCFGGESRFAAPEWERTPGYRAWQRGAASLLFFASVVLALSAGGRLPFLYYQF